MAKQGNIESCSKCPFVSDVLDGGVVRCGHDKTPGMIILVPRLIHPDCPLPDVLQCATGPWLPMSGAPKDETEILMCTEGNDIYLIAWDLINQCWQDEDGQPWPHHTAPMKCFAHIYPPEVQPNA